MWKFSSHADKLRAKLIKKHLVNFRNEITASNDTNMVSEQLSNSVDNGTHHRHVSDCVPVNDDFRQTACHDVNNAPYNPSSVLSSHGKTIPRINEKKSISRNS